MRFECSSLDRALREAEGELIREAQEHAKSCAACSERLRSWKEISEAAAGLHGQWDSPELWPRIRESLALESAHRVRSPSLVTWQGAWRSAIAAAAVLLIAMSAVWVTWRNSKEEAPAGITSTAEESQRRLLTEQALKEIESAETTYIESIEKLSKLVEPRMQQATSQIMVAYREKLVLLDSAIADCRAQAARNRFNTHLRQELLAAYREKQHTLQEVIKEGKNAVQ